MSYSYTQNGIYFHHSYDENPNADRFMMHAHENCELYYFISGNGTYFVEGNEYRLSPGCVLLLRPGETHNPQLQAGEPYERMAVHFPQKLLLSLDANGALLTPFENRQAGRQNQYLPGQINTEFVRSCFEAMMLPAEETDQNRYLAVVANLPPVLFELRRAFLQLNPADEKPETLIGRVVDYINRNLTGELNLDLLSARFFISKSYLNQQFRQVTGTTIWDYILLKRLLSARENIRGGVPVTEAFRTSGFHDYSSFYRRYKDRFGVSPKEDRPGAGKG